MATIHLGSVPIVIHFDGAWSIEAVNAFIETGKHWSSFGTMQDPSFLFEDILGCLGYTATSSYEVFLLRDLQGQGRFFLCGEDFPSSSQHHVIDETLPPKQ
jgi:hypothetical protein